MREKTLGVVFLLVPYNDKYAFARVYTRRFGRVTYSIPLTKSKRAKINRSLFSPFSILELEVEHQPDRDIQKIHEAHVAQVNMSLISDPVKNAIAMVLAEFLAKAIREREQNEPLFDFILNSIGIFDLVEQGKANFHLVFLSRIADFLGLRINRSTYTPGARFGMFNGVFTTDSIDHQYVLPADESQLLHQALSMSFSDMADHKFNRSQRALILKNMVDFYKIHLPDLKELKSLEVLSQLFS